ncbi:hypothetical protein MKW94_027870 [Papaver nudicaule]|uniref:DUF1985 domain-containing protein n=1 Tax=Papaver nudicaule TaxID=74823 RepID=A0AA41VW51_PAPNU|nr:hypothetical protein [Papaver nudicaule]
MDLYDFLFFKTVAVDGKNRLEEVAKKTNSQKFKPRRTIYQDVEPRPCEAEVRVKVALLYVVHMFLLGNQDTLQIEADTWHLVDNLSLFNKFPWAERVYKATIEKSDTAFKSQIKTESEKEKKTQMSSDDMPTVKPKGMPHVLVVWFLMLFPGVLRDWGIKKNVERWRPHMIDVLCLKKVHHAQLCASVEQSVFSEDMMMRHRNDSELLVILGAAKGPLNLKQLEDLETECMLGKQWEAMMGDTRLLIPEESTGNTISVEIVTSPTRRQGKAQATEARNKVPKVGLWKTLMMMLSRRI